jgi:hypothetical protein
MESNEIWREQINETIENQLKSNNPVEIGITLKRLINDGFNDFEAKQLIGKCLAVELFGAINNNESYNENRYTRNLNKLPEEPLEE